MADSSSSFLLLARLRRLRPWLAGAAIALATGTARGDWQLVWSDEFNGNSVDPNHWKFEVGNHHGWGNHELEDYTDHPENVCVSNGVLHIIARSGSADRLSYTSARLKSQGLFAAQYGRFEFLAKFPGGRGFWPALWLMPEHSAYGGWPACGEIDIMENRGSNPTTVQGTIHYASADGRHLQSAGRYMFPPNDGATNYHTYLLEWTTNSIKWFVDNHLYEVQTNWSTARAAYPAPFNQPFYIIMNLAVGGDYGGNPDAQTIFPGEMQVDYVRVYSNVARKPLR